MSFRDTQLYKEMTLYKAVRFIEHFNERLFGELEYLTSWQYIADTNAWTFLQGWYYRQMWTLINQNLIDKPKELNGKLA